MSNVNFSPGHGSIVGSYHSIDYNDKIKSLKISLSSQSISGQYGRMITCMYWIVDNNFNINDLDWSKAFYATNISSSYGVVKNHYGSNNLPSFLSTKIIPQNITWDVTFSDFTDLNHSNNRYYGKTIQIPSTSIFVALVSNDGIGEVLEHTLNECQDLNSYYLAVPYEYGGYHFYKDGQVTGSNRMKTVTYGKLIISDDSEHANDDQDEDGNVNSLSKIKCKEISYRTWSAPKETITVNNSTFNSNYLLSYLDGGENNNDVTITSNNSEITYNGNKKARLHLIQNRTDPSTKFIDDYYLPEGRLSDVTFDNPQSDSYIRWVFKRSRIKFVIPKYDNKNRNIDVSLQIKTGVYSFENRVDNNNLPLYYNKEIVKTYKTNQDIVIVICPRDEGVLDNMPFEVILKRKFSNSNRWSTEAVYKFHTYQRPTVNIVYPKITRNESIGQGFRYAKICANTNFSNFNGENSKLSKHICDSLITMFAVPKNDDSGIPIFIRYYLAEYKYGRTGLLDQNDEFNTLQDLYKSKKSEDYVTLNEILTNNAGNKLTAYLTNICVNDGRPLLFSGRMSENNINIIGNEYKLWTYKNWNEVSESNDVIVGNAWPIYDSNDQLVSAPTIGDHYGIPNKDKNNLQTIDKGILFRAGYIYLLRARSFHGACCGAIHGYYANINPNTYGNSNSGKYDYDGAAYHKEVPTSDGINTRIIEYPISDKSVYGNEQPYEGWLGCDDGTIGQPLLAKYNYGTQTLYKINQTYPGFSPVDYTIFEVVCPYVSKSNMISVHPTSSEIGANQWITFSYRHLSKNIGSIDSYAIDADGNFTGGNYFGKKSNGIQNTMTRIMSMHTSCVEKIMNAYFSYRDKWIKDQISSTIGCKNPIGHNVITLEEFTLIPETIENYNNYINDSNYDYKNTLDYNNSQPDNKPFINNFSNNGRSSDDFYRDTFYNRESGLYYFNNYRLTLQPQNGSYRGPQSTYSYGNESWNWTEDDLIWRSPKSGKTGTLDEPFGNVYRWQVVVNAMSSSNSEQGIEEIQIEDQNNSEALNYSSNTYALKLPSGVTFYDGEGFNKLYESGGTDQNLQTKYFYQESDFKTTNVIISNSSTVRFTINEFAGLTTGDTDKFPGSPGSPVLYTTASIKTTDQQTPKYFKLFITNDDNPNSYGKLFVRIPSSQDCENGTPLTKTTLSNIGSISLNPPSNNNLNIIGNNSEINIDVNNTGKESKLPLVRTTHYLYFKTYILTSYKLFVHLKFTPWYCYEDGEGGTHHERQSELEGNWYFTGNGFQDQEYYFRFGNNGLSEVYGEDNRGWGRCLSGDDDSNVKINIDGTYKTSAQSNGLSKLNDIKTKSGGVEVPVLIRRTPMLQPTLICETIKNVYNNATSDIDDYLPSSKLITLENKKGDSYITFDMNYNGTIKTIRTKDYNLNICYPFIAENKNYYTRMPNGGRDNVWYNGYYLDLDSDPFRESKNKENEDFFGGYGICTSYTVILVPNDINITKAISDNIFNNNEVNFYFRDLKKKNAILYGRLEYFKQKANFYKNSNIYKLESISNSKAKPVLVAYDYTPTIDQNMFEEYLKNGKVKNSDKYFKDAPGRNFQSIPINPEYLRNGKVLRGRDEMTTLDSIFNPDGPKEFKDNNIKGKIIYDLLVIPNYSDTNIKDYQFVAGEDKTVNGKLKKGSGKIISSDNDTFYNFGGSIDDNDILFAGSNPLVYNNYFAVESVDPDPRGGGGGGHIPDPEPSPDPDKICDSDACIVFPNVDNELYGVNNGVIKEPPGFWLNNTFRLILRMPSFRDNSTRLGYTDLNTVENQSNNSPDVTSANKILFADIQIHIGKLEDDLLDIDNIEATNELICGDGFEFKQNRLSKHIYSYKDFPQIFSKKLYADNDSNNYDKRELLTAGAINYDDEAYKNRFVEVNLSLLDNIQTLYDEGYYVQFRWKTQYATGNEGSTWSKWYGGSNDGGLHWWTSEGGSNLDDKGCGYFVPVRNYTDIHTDFRNYIKESYPGSLIKSIFGEPVTDNNFTFIKAETGKGSKMSHGVLDENSKTKPKSSTNTKYHINGNGNTNTSNIVPGESVSNNIIKDVIYTVKNNYKSTHDSTFNKFNDISSNNQQMWEMLYLDYIISNMCKLYFKPKHNGSNSGTFTGALNSLNYACSLPSNVNPLNWKCVGWSNTEYTLIESKQYNSQFNIKNNQNEIIENMRETTNFKSNEEHLAGFNINKYYRRTITKNDFDELNSHLDELLSYIKQSALSGNNNSVENVSYPNGIKNVLPIKNEYLFFEKHRKEIIGSNIIKSPSQSNINNIYQLMGGINYLQAIYSNIKAVCSINEMKGNIDIEVDD